MNRGGNAPALPPYRLHGVFGGASPLLLSSPHSGTHVPAGFASRLPRTWLRRIEDAHVAELVRPAAEACGAPLIEATHARAVIDLNRAEDEYDPQTVAGALPHPPRSTERVRAGYGLIPRIIAPGQPISTTPTPAATILERLNRLHRPYHAALAAGIAAARARHGHALLVDCHSMPSLVPASRANLVIGDRHGHSAAPVISDFLSQCFTSHGLVIARNRPYAGGHIAQFHGRPAEGVHVIQIEVDRALYMDCNSLVPHAGFAPLTAVLADVLGALADALPALLPHDLPLAAE